MAKLVIASEVLRDPRALRYLHEWQKAQKRAKNQNGAGSRLTRAVFGIDPAHVSADAQNKAQRMKSLALHTRHGYRYWTPGVFSSKEMGLAGFSEEKMRLRDVRGPGDVLKLAFGRRVVRVVYEEAPPDENEMPKKPVLGRDVRRWNQGKLVSSALRLANRRPTQMEKHESLPGIPLLQEQSEATKRRKVIREEF